MRRAQTALAILAIGAALPALQSSLADAYPTFAAWNAGTGARAGTSGYTNAKTYPEVKLTPFPATGSVSDIGGMSGSVGSRPEVKPIDRMRPVDSPSRRSRSSRSRRCISA